MEILNNVNKLMELRESLPSYQKLKLQTGVEGFENPNVYGVYKKEGNGKPLGVVGDVFHPMDNKLFFDALYQNLGDSNLDLNTLSFNEYKGGKRISFDIQSDDFVVSSSPVLNDAYKVKLRFSTGLDGGAKLQLGFSVLRLVCMNGNKGWKDEISINFKNTTGNHAKAITFLDEIKEVQFSVNNYKQEMESLASKKVDKQQINDFYKQLLGYNYDDYADLHKKSQNILDSINQSVLIEASALNLTELSLVNGVTRYVTHNLKNQNKEENYLYGAGESLNRRCHQILLN